MESSDIRVAFALPSAEYPAICGVPISTLSSNSRLISGSCSHTSITASENVPDTFAEKIEYILESNDIYSQFSRNALKRFEEDLTVDKMVGEYLKIYKAKISH